MKNPQPPVYQNIHLPILKEKQINLQVKRLDILHPLLQGNKFYKLKYNLFQAMESGHSTLLTFGGAYSNHVLATAQAAKLNNFKSIGLIRGEIQIPLNPTLAHAHDLGMRLQSISRSDYREKTASGFLSELRKKFGDFYLLPEGGTNALAIKGAEEILSEDDMKADFVAVPIGTGGTFCGLLASANTHPSLLGFSSLKGDFIFDDINKSITKYSIIPKCPWVIFNSYHFGGYAKSTPDLIQFILDFKKLTGIPLDPIYTGKMMFGLLDLIKNDYFPAESRVMVIHTGGLQGVRGFNERHGTAL